MKRLLLVITVLFLCGQAHGKCDDTHLTLKVGDLVITAEVAKTEAQRAKGLMGRRSLPKNWGMWFSFGGPSMTSFWMKNTYVPLDMIFIGSDLRIVHIHENAHPMDETPIGSPTVFWHVLEVPAGFAKSHRLKVGDPILNLTPNC